MLLSYRGLVVVKRELADAPLTHLVAVDITGEADIAAILQLLRNLTEDACDLVLAVVAVLSEGSVVGLDFQLEAHGFPWLMRRVYQAAADVKR